MYLAANVSTPDLSPLQCRYNYYNRLTSQIGRSFAQVVKVRKSWI